MINFIIPIILLIIVLFIGFNFYKDIKHWMNTGNFVEGLTPQTSSKSWNGFNYVLNKELKTWEEHKQIAKERGGDLVCIHSKEENDIVKSLIPKYQEGVTPNYIFIGAKRLKACEEDNIEECRGGTHWSWVDGSKWDYTNWGNGEPNDCCKDDTTEQKGEPLGMMWENGLWNDIFNKHTSWAKGNPWNTDGTIRFPAVYKFFSEEELRKAYRDILGREPDIGGFNYWKSQLQNGMTIAELRTAFENSDEAKSKKLSAPAEQQIECAAHFGSSRPSDGSNSGTVATKYVCPESKPICKDYKFNVSWGYCTSENSENTITNTAPIDPVSMETPSTAPAPIENKAMLQQPTIQNADVMVIPTDNSLFNDSIMKQVLENKNVIPSDINLALEKQNNYVRIGKNFMTGVSDVRNVELPHINDDDFESLGRIVVKIKRNVDQDSNSPQNSLYKKELMNSVNYILSGTQLKHSNVNWKAPGQAITARTTGMLGDNSNKIINNNGQSNNQPLNTKEIPLPWNATESGKF